MHPPIGPSLLCSVVRSDWLGGLSPVHTSRTDDAVCGIAKLALACCVSSVNAACCPVVVNGW